MDKHFFFKESFSTSLKTYVTKYDWHYTYINGNKKKNLQNIIVCSNTNQKTSTENYQKHWDIMYL